MNRTAPNRLLIFGAILSASAAALHLGCIVFGAAWYRFLGAGEAMAGMAESGHWHPTLVTLFISAMLLLWSMYALSGAGVLRRLPFLRTALCLIAGIYLLRGVGFVLLMPHFPDNSLSFWITSSAICLTFGVIHTIGLRQVWASL